MCSKTTADIPGLNPTSEENGNIDDIAKAGRLHDFLVQLHEQFGPIASFWWGKQYAVSIASAELFEEQQNLFDRPLMGPYAMLTPFLEPKSISFANGEAGERRVKHYREALTNQALNKYYPLLQEVIDEIVAVWSNLVGEERIPLLQYTSRFSSRATIHALFGKVLKGHSKAEFDIFREAEEVWTDIELTFMKPKTTETDKHLQEDEKDMKKLMKQLLDDRKERPPQQGEENLLEWIISHTDDEETQIADVMQFAMSGQYATEYLLAAVIYYIATHPDVDKTIFAEIMTELGDKEVDGNNIDDLIYLRQVLDETLRCCIVSTWEAKYLTVDSKIGGYDIPRNTYIIQAVGVTLKNEEVWPDPEVFDPDRFSKQSSAKRSKFDFCPFGVGKRECVARDFAYAEATVALVTIHKKFKVQLADNKQVFTPVHAFVSHAKEEILIKLLPR